MTVGGDQIAGRPAVEVYSIGAELLSGQIQDTNAFWIAQQIATLGGFTRRITVLGDRVDDLVSTLAESCDRGTRILITTGGLGPTSDDLTIQAVAKVAGVETYVDEGIVGHFMETREIARREDVSVGLVKMATIPFGSRVYPNPAGVAPCVETHVGSAAIFSLPGPPNEVKALFRTCLEAPVSLLYEGKRAVRSVVVNLPESECGPILQRVMEMHPNTYLKAFVAMSEKAGDGQRLPVDIVAWGRDEEAAQSLVEEAQSEFTSQVTEKGSHVLFV